MKAVFDFAVGEELIDKSPMRLLKAPKYEKHNGVALTLAEEREFIERLNASNCNVEIRQALLFLLYTGMRRSELASVCVNDGFVTVISAKTRKGYQEKRRAIPITPMLARWLPSFNLDAIRNVRPDALTQALKRLMPKHHLHELRHTFITRCQECGVAREVVSVWAGHAADNTMTSNVYTHFSPEFMKKEAQKVNYDF
jgi:integrase